MGARYSDGCKTLGRVALALFIGFNTAACSTSSNLGAPYLGTAPSIEKISDLSAKYETQDQKKTWESIIAGTRNNILGSMERVVYPDESAAEVIDPESEHTMLVMFASLQVQMMLNAYDHLGLMPNAEDRELMLFTMQEATKIDYRNIPERQDGDTVKTAISIDLETQTCRAYGLATNGIEVTHDDRSLKIDLPAPAKARCNALMERNLRTSKALIDGAFKADFDEFKAAYIDGLAEGSKGKDFNVIDYSTAKSKAHQNLSILRKASTIK